MMKGSTHKKETLTLNVSVPNNSFKIYETKLIEVAKRSIQIHW